MTTTLRFAPSPTGLVHVGNLRTALFNWLSAADEDSRFLLRFDDTDADRSRSTFADAILADLKWIGVEPDEVFRQSDRINLYDEAAEKLKSAGVLYPCYETADELEEKRQRQRRRGLPPVYDRAALNLTSAEKSAFEASARKPHWRFLLGSSHEIVWADVFRGEQRIALGSLSDPVLVREDGTYLYTLPSVVDDIDKGVTRIVRGEDHVTNTAVQIELFRALASEPPEFGHHNLLTAASGEGLSKRTGARSIASLREAGYEAIAVATLATLIGTSSPVEPMADLEALAAVFSGAKVSRSPARFDLAELDSLNARLLHQTAYPDVADRLAAMEIDGGDPFWTAIRGNCTKLEDAAIWWRVVSGDIDPPDLATDADLLTVAVARLPDEPWGETTFKLWVELIKGEIANRGRALFNPLRLALTGLDHGPELAALLPLIGRNNTRDRLAASLGR